jgi:hypothetical protein
MGKCLCGCGEECKSGNKYINGHNTKGIKLSDDHKKKISDSRKGYICTEETKTKLREINTGRKVSDESKRKMSESRKGRKFSEQHRSKFRLKVGEKAPNWRGGSYTHFHDKAWKHFGKMYCEICFMNINEHFEKYGCRFSMHNTLVPKDYKSNDPKAWKCVCYQCHTKLDAKQKSRGNR